MKIKAISVLNSRNFLVSAVAIVLLLLGYMGVNTGLTPEEAVNTFSNPVNMSVIITLVLSIVTKVTANIQAGTLTLKGFFSSPNAVTQLLTIVFLAVGGYYGIQEGTIISLVTLIVNVLYHLKEPVTPEIPLPTQQNEEAGV